jgi:hypothetical protein
VNERAVGTDQSNVSSWWSMPKQGGVPRGHARPRARRPARRDQRAEAGRADHRQRPAARRPASRASRRSVRMDARRSCSAQTEKRLPSDNARVPGARI